MILRIECGAIGELSVDGSKSSAAGPKETDAEIIEIVSLSWPFLSQLFSRSAQVATQFARY